MTKDLINKETIHYLAKLSRIACSAEEEERLLIDLAKIVGYMTKLDEVDTDSVEPTLQIFPELINVVRDDEVEPSLDRAAFLANAPSHTGGMVRVPPIL